MVMNPLNFYVSAKSLFNLHFWKIFLLGRDFYDNILFYFDFFFLFTSLKKSLTRIFWFGQFLPKKSTAIFIFAFLYIMSFFKADFKIFLTVIDIK